MSTTMFVDYYAILGVTRQASIKEINIAWKRFALQYHPDKSPRKNTDEKFGKVSQTGLTTQLPLSLSPLDPLHEYRELTDSTSQGREAVETLRDPRRRDEYNRRLEAHHPLNQMSNTGWDCGPPQTSSASSQPMDPHFQNYDEPRNGAEPENNQNKASPDNGSNDPNDPSRRRTWKQMEKIFETVKMRERERKAAEGQDTPWAPAEPNFHQPEADPEMHSFENGYYPYDYHQAKAEGAQTIYGKGKMAGEINEPVSLGQFLKNYVKKTGTRGRPGIASRRRSTFKGSVNTCVQGSPNRSYQFSNAGSSSGSDDSSNESGGVRLTEFETQDEGEQTLYSDCYDPHTTVPNHDPASSNPRSSSMSTEQPTWESMPSVNNDNAQWPFHRFVPYIKAKLNDPSGRYTPDDMHQELRGLVLDPVSVYLENKRLSHSNASPAPATGGSSTCSHLGFWHKDFGQPECDICHLLKPLYTLVCPGCGLKRCVRCKFEGYEI
jgi:curved DNA-binding protein CbpA